MKFHHPVKGMVDIDALTIQAKYQLFLMTSYVYYHKFDNLIPDEVFDYLCKSMINDIHLIEDSLISSDDLKAGTGYAIKYDQYPVRAIVGADMWMREEYGESR